MVQSFGTPGEGHTSRTVPARSTSTLERRLRRETRHISKAVNVESIHNEIDNFLVDIREGGYVLKADRTMSMGSFRDQSNTRSSSIKTPGEIKPLELSRLPPKVNQSTKPMGSARTVTNHVEILPRTQYESTSNAWKRLGSVNYHFIGEDGVMQR